MGGAVRPPSDGPVAPRRVDRSEASSLGCNGAVEPGERVPDVLIGEHIGARGPG